MNEGTESSKLDEPIKVRFTGKFRTKLNERSMEYDGKAWELINRTLNRQKTNVVIKTEEEAESLISKLSGYENGRTWMTGGMNKCATRVKTQIQTGLKMDDEDEKEETESEHEEPSAQPVAADGGEDVHAELVGMVECSECGMNTLNETLDGWVCMACNTTFESDRFEREELVADGGMPPGERDFIHGKPAEEEDEETAMTDGGMIENVNMAVQENGITILECPGCGYENLHQSGVEVFDRSDELHTTVEYDDGITVDDSMEDNPSSRRDGIKICFWCEHCAGSPANPTFELNIVQYKGREKMYWKSMEDNDE